MPLILFAGYPSSGKTTWAKKLVAAFEEKIASLQPNEQGANMKVILHNDESLGIPHSAYKESVTEKSARGSQISAVKRDLSRTNIVILDSLAYIKGFRYQLHCESKALSTPHCVIQVLAPSEICFQWNSERPEEEKWDEDLLRALIMRYEEPDGQNRWDSPLIPIGYDEPTLPFAQIWETVVLKKGPRPNNATVLKPAISANFLQDLDRITSEVVNSIVQHQQLQSVGGEVQVKNSKDEKFYIEMPSNSVSLAQLQRFRRTYISLNRMRTVDTDRIVPLFVDYLNHALNADS